MAFGACIEKTASGCFNIMIDGSALAVCISYPFKVIAKFLNFSTSVAHHAIRGLSTTAFQQYCQSHVLAQQSLILLLFLISPFSLLLQFFLLGSYSFIIFLDISQLVFCEVAICHFFSGVVENLHSVPKLVFNLIGLYGRDIF